jgi:hypothetical protein
MKMFGDINQKENKFSKLVKESLVVEGLMPTTKPPLTTMSQ